MNKQIQFSTGRGCAAILENKHGEFITRLDVHTPSKETIRHAESLVYEEGKTYQLTGTIFATRQNGKIVYLEA